ncbi:hypothetical protein D3C81_1347720 [compost metagenome]
MLQQPGDAPRQAEHAAEDAGEQHQQEIGVGGLPGLVQIALHELAQGTRYRGNRAQQLIVDAADEGDGTPGHTRNHVGGAHRHALGKQQEIISHRSFP